MKNMMAVKKGDVHINDVVIDGLMFAFKDICPRNAKTANPVKRQHNLKKIPKARTKSN
jgi:hypothetical protein